MTGDASPGGNRLAAESSPYLLLHRHNPVDWYPWGEEALERARREAKPIFLSVGYSTCYWCHVMERESFADPATAEVMNRHFVNVKVDREERPELDEVYMAATQLLTGQGGWPNSLFLTPELEPFYAGTYFPPDDRYGRPGFPQLLRGLAEAWRTRRAEVERQAGEVAAAMRRFLEERAAPTPEPPTEEVARGSLRALERRFDERWGGFGGAPKFPTPSNLFLLLDFADEEPEAAQQLALTLDRMARGGIYDQLGGGFHRYATDREWRVPHFEKMLYDNAQLLELYARHHRRTGEPQAARIVGETARFLDRELGAPEGGFWSAIDAETDGHEGLYYAWTREELEAVLGSDDTAFLAPVYGFDGPPFFDGRYVLHLPRPVAELAAERGEAEAALWQRLDPLRARLLAARQERPRPLVDDKVLTDWNGMAIAGLATAGRMLGEEALVRRAARAADFVLTALRPAGAPLLHSWRAGTAKLPAYLADYVFLVRGLLALYRADGAARWRAQAAELTAEQVERLGDPRGGFYAAAEAPDLLLRSKEVFDGALPAANAVAVLNLLELAAVDGEEGRWRELAEAALCAFARYTEQQPDGARMLCLGAGRYRRGSPAAETPPSTAAPPDAAVDPAVEARAVVRGEAHLAPPDAAGWRRFVLALEVREGWHLYAHRPGAAWAPATELVVEGGELRAVRYPEGEAEGLLVYRGTVELTGEVRGRGDQEPTLHLRYQACDDQRCLPPTTLTIPSAG